MHPYWCLFSCCFCQMRNAALTLDCSSSSSSGSGSGSAGEHMLQLNHLCMNAGTFAGAALFITAVEHPAAMKDSCSNFYSYFTQMYPRCATVACFSQVNSISDCAVCAQVRRVDARLLCS
jgi:hypothetical protein